MAMSESSQPTDLSAAALTEDTAGTAGTADPPTETGGVVDLADDSPATSELGPAEEEPAAAAAEPPAHVLTQSEAIEVPAVPIIARKKELTYSFDTRESISRGPSASAVFGVLDARGASVAPMRRVKAKFSITYKIDEEWVALDESGPPAFATAPLVGRRDLYISTAPPGPSWHQECVCFPGFARRAHCIRRSWAQDGPGEGRWICIDIVALTRASKPLASDIRRLAPKKEQACAYGAPNDGSPPSSVLGPPPGASRGPAARGGPTLRRRRGRGAPARPRRGQASSTPSSSSPSTRTTTTITTASGDDEWRL
eukprot:2116301-Pyramimonas_sp.AAC.1